MNKFVPEIYKHLGTTVSLDLGKAAEIGAIHEGVDTLTQTVSTGLDQLNQNDGELLLKAATLDTTTTSVLHELRSEAVKAEHRFHTLEALITHRDQPEEPLELTIASEGPVRALVNLQLRLLNKDTVKFKSAKDSALKALGSAPELQTRLIEACNKVDVNTLLKRSQFFWAIHQLIEDVADHWDQEHDSGASVALATPAESPATATT